MSAHRVAAGSIEVVVGDLVQMDTDAIVNAANEGLLAGGGVCGAIFRAAGHAQLQKACNDVAPCPTGEARITPAFSLPARYVIHAVGPVWRGGENGEPERLAGAYRSSLQLANANKLTSVAFPAISTGIFGYPLEAATSIAVGSAIEVLSAEDGSLRRVVFVVRDAATEALYEAALAELL